MREVLYISKFNGFDSWNFFVYFLVFSFFLNLNEPILQPLACVYLLFSKRRKYNQKRGCPYILALLLNWLRFAHKVALVKIDSFTYIKFNGTKKIRKFWIASVCGPCKFYYNNGFPSKIWIWGSQWPFFSNTNLLCWMK